VQFVISCLAGEVLSVREAKAEWKRIRVEPLTREGRRELLVAYLGHYNKRLPSDLQELSLSHPLADNPLWLRTLAEELRLFGSHEELAARLKTLLGPPEGKAADEAATVEDLFEHVLARVEQDVGKHAVRSAMTGLWASRAGLSEPELLGITGLKPAQWARLRLSVDDMLLESSGRLVFAHDYIRTAVKQHCLLSEQDQRKAHAKVAKYFAALPVDARVAEEAPWQWHTARDWSSLRKALTQREMLEAVLAHREQDELLSYWLDLEREAEVDIEQEYGAAWKRWSPDEAEEATGDLADCLAKFLSHAGRYQAVTERLTRLALEIAVRIYGQESGEAAWRMNRVAQILSDKGDYEGAEPLQRRALAINEKALGSQNVFTAVSLGGLATILRLTGKYKEAEPLYWRALDVTEKALGPEHPETATSLNNLAALLRKMGDYSRPEPLYRRALAIREKTVGPEHPDTAAVIHNLALLLKKQRAYDRAELLYRRALTIAERALGPEHPETGRILNNLAALLDDKGDQEGAERLCRRALAIREKTLGPEHPDTAESLASLARFLKEKRDYEGAETLCRRALAIREKALIPEHLDMASSLRDLACLLHEKRDLDGAELLYRRALDITEKALGPEHPDTAESLNYLAVLLFKRGDYAGAEPLFRRVLAIRGKTLDLEHPDTAGSLNNLAALLDEKGDHAGAEPLCRRALAIREKTLGPEHQDTAASLNSLAVILRNKGDYEYAEPLCRRALAALGPEHPYTAAFRNNLRLLLDKLGRKPDPALLVSRGDFLSVAAYAKAVACRVSSLVLEARHFLAALPLAERDDRIWGEELGESLSAEVRRWALVACRDLDVNPSEQLAPLSAKMPLAEDLKKLIGAHACSTMTDFLEAVAAHAYGGPPSTKA